MRVHACGVPGEHCKGSAVVINKAGAKAHKTPQEAFKCRRKYLIAQGYTPVGNRELRDPLTGEVTVLTKPSRFGAPLRLGKRGEQGSAYTGNRVTYVRPGAAGAVLSL